MRRQIANTIPRQLSAVRRTLGEQPRGVVLLFFTEFWERFSYYGMLGLTVLFLVAPVSKGGFGWDNARALSDFGSFLSLVWLAPIVGGWVADRLTGPQRAVIYGCAGLSLGNFLLSGSAWLVKVTAISNDGPNGRLLFYVGLAWIVVGAGLFKGNVAVLMGHLFEKKDDLRRDFGFTLFYMGINLGALTAPLVAGTLGERVGWHWGFLASALGMLVGLVVFLCFKHQLRFDGREREGERQAVLTETLGSGLDARRSLVIAIFAVFATVFAAGILQYGGLLNLFTAQDIDRRIGTFEVPTTWFLTLNPLYIVVFGPMVATAWDAISVSRHGISSIDKFGVGLVLMAIAFGLIAIVAMSASPYTQKHWFWIVGFYLIFTVGELCVNPVGLALVSKLAPARAVGVLMGAWYLTNAIGGWIAGQLGVLAQNIGNASVFGAVAVVALMSAIVLWGLRHRLISLAGATP